MSATRADYAARYIEFGFKLVPLNGKVPIGEAWNSDANLIGTAQGARDYWTRNPRHNVGACLGPSGLVSLDADYADGAQTVLAAEGVDLERLMAVTPTIMGRAPRLEFKAPQGIELGRKSIVWPPKAPGEKPITVLEFRAGRVQDVLPPSIHPVKRRPYCWWTPPRNGFPALPEPLLRLWLDFDAFRHRARNLCPWADPEPVPEKRPARRIRERTGPSVIDAFNDAHDAAAILESCGYERAGKRRFKSPNGHGMAGVVLLPSGKVFCHHQSDQLGGAHAHDAFDVFAILQHRGDYRAAVKAAAAMLGIDQRERAP